MIINSLLEVCDKRYQDNQDDVSCESCSYKEFCPHDCEICLDYIHTPRNAPAGAPKRKYDCERIADFYICKYSCRYTSEMIYAFQLLKDIKNKSSLKVLALGCAPCTDLMALDYLKTQGELDFMNLEYRGVDYSRDVWQNIHSDIQCLSQGVTVKLYYQDICEFIDNIGEDTWIPDLVTFQYFLSDLHKHSEAQSVEQFLSAFAQFSNTYMVSNSYIVLNDVNLGTRYGGGRDYFEKLESLLSDCTCRKGRFCNDNSRSPFYTRGYTYGEDSDGEFPVNTNFFNISHWSRYAPFNTCASAQMLIKRR